MSYLTRFLVTSTLMFTLVFTQAGVVNAQTTASLLSQLQSIQVLLTNLQALSNTAVQHPVGEVLGSATTNGLVGHWKLDDAAGNLAGDTSGNGHNGTVIGDPVWLSDGTLDLDGDGDGVTLASSNDFDFSQENAFTISALVRPDTTGGGVFTRGSRGSSPTYTVYSFGVYGSDPSRWQFVISDGTTIASVVTDRGTVDDGAWQRMTATWDGTTMSIYNGTNLLSSQSTDVVLWNGGGITKNQKTGIGFDPANNRSYWNGQLDDVRVYDRALSVDEISALDLTPAAPSVVEEPELEPSSPEDDEITINDEQENDETTAVDEPASGYARTLSDHGVTWTFAEEVQYGEYVTGGYWVVGPVTITGISPDANDGFHGWNVNPQTDQTQPYDKRARSYSADTLPSLPYSAQPGDSIIKTVSVDTNQTSCRPCVDEASILTVVTTPPPSDAFRPAYAGTEKPQYRTSDIDYDLVPEVSRRNAGGDLITLPVYSGTNAPDYDRSGNDLPSLESVQDQFARPWIDHVTDWPGREIHPVQHMPDYGGDIANRTGTAVLRLMLDDPLNDKKPALHQVIQYAVDLEGMMLGAGTRFPGNGGHSNGRKLPLALGAVLLNDPEMKSLVSTNIPDRWSESDHVYYGAAAVDGEGTFLLGDGVSIRERDYWTLLETGNGFRTAPDPYGYIDGGPRAGDAYLIPINAALWKAPVLAMQFMPELRTVWNDDRLAPLVERYVTHGKWTQPDPCAPFDGDSANRGVTYGPDGNGGCVLDVDSSDGIGRFPDLHGTCADGCAYARYRVPIADALWYEYYKYDDSDHLPSQTNVEEAAFLVKPQPDDPCSEIRGGFCGGLIEPDPEIIQNDLSEEPSVNPIAPTLTISYPNPDWPSRFASNTTVNTTDNLTVRDQPNGTRLGVQSLGSSGTVTNLTPVTTAGYTWVNVDFTNSPDGWVADEFLSTQTINTSDRDTEILAQIAQIMAMIEMLQALLEQLQVEQG